MLYRFILVLGAEFIKIMDLLAREGSILDDFVAEKSMEISIFLPSKTWG